MLFQRQHRRGSTVHAKRPAREIDSAYLTRLNSSVVKKKIDIRKTSRRSHGPTRACPPTAAGADAPRRRAFNYRTGPKLLSPAALSTARAPVGRVQVIARTLLSRSGNEQRGPNREGDDEGWDAAWLTRSATVPRRSVPSPPGQVSRSRWCRWSCRTRLT